MGFHIYDIANMYTAQDLEPHTYGGDVLSIKYLGLQYDYLKQGDPSNVLKKIVKVYQHTDEVEVKR